MTPPTGWIQKLYTIAAQISCQTSRVEDGNYVIISRYSLNCSLHCFLTLLESKCSPGKDRNIRQLCGLVPGLCSSLWDSIHYLLLASQLFRACLCHTGDGKAEAHDRIKSNKCQI